MPYHIYACLDDRGSGAFKADAETKEQAFRKARDLQLQGLKVRVTDPNGEPVSEGGE